MILNFEAIQVLDNALVAAATKPSGPIPDGQEEVAVEVLAEWVITQQHVAELKGQLFVGGGGALVVLVCYRVCSILDFFGGCGGDYEELSEVFTYWILLVAKSAGVFGV